MENEKILIAKEVSISHGTQSVVQHIHFSMEKAEFVYLIGKTGSGKTSLLKTLYAELPLQKGNIQLLGYELSKLDRKETPFLRRKMGIVFQDFQLLTDRNIEENLSFVLKATGWDNRNKIKLRIGQVLAQVGLFDVEKKMPHQLSGGEQQRVSIARALLNDPILLLADEPTGNLDPAIANEIVELFIRINQGGTAIIMATHNHFFLKKYPARVLWCENGQVKDISKEEVKMKMTEP
ncbi:cell division ATP-binding protein FtsE [Thermoflexibacter ruber]|uniref:Cell division transport system ATP-binding protein n=1 Tax=Thermoflexibacter ruber TaxID=1003 RepID=A0A1I2CJV0_9BACT|nr:ATP-binding cassette domain-containing protein [Thermoflexibacter ruber]SFE68679.1 cell division transport system ATP-binding protein [Thermoflexibacter ruber]